MTGKDRIYFEMPVKEKKWFLRLVQAGGYRSNIALWRELLDRYAREINFDPRPK